MHAFHQERSKLLESQRRSLDGGFWSAGAMRFQDGVVAGDGDGFRVSGSGRAASPAAAVKGLDICI